MFASVKGIGGSGRGQAATLERVAFNRFGILLL